MKVKRVLWFQLILCMGMLTEMVKSDECSDLLSTYLNTINPVDFSNPLNMAGTGFNDLGKYDTCIHNPANKYILVRMMFHLTVPITTTLPLFMGVCLPQQCMTEDNFNIIKNKISSNFGIAVEKIEVIDSEKENSKNQVWTASSICIFILLSVYMLFGIGLVKLFYDICIPNQIKEEIREKNIENKEINLDGNNKSATSDETSFFSSESSQKSFNEDHKKLLKNLNDKENSSSNELKMSTEDNGKVNTKSTFYTVLEKCFDVKKNFANIFETRPTDDKDLKIFDGVRVITCTIIIVDHLVGFITENPLRNPVTFYEEYFKSFKWQFFFNSYYTVDVFFSLSGFFLAYISLKNLKALKTASIPQILFSIYLRLIRIWPVCILLFLFYWKFFVFFLDGPISGYIFNKEINSCEIQWPYMMTLISNFTYGVWETAYPICFDWFWYIPNDFQYSVIGVLFLVIYARNRKIFYVLFAGVNLVFMGIEAWLIIDLDLGVNIFELNNDDRFFRQFYMKFYTRSSPFWIGFLLGIIYSNYKRDLANSIYSKTTIIFEHLKDSKFMSLVSYLMGLFIMMSMTFCTYWSYDERWSFTLRFLYNLFGKKLYVFGLFMFCFPLMAGNLYPLGGWLADPFFLPLAKLSFAAYLFHPFLIKYFLYNVRYSIMVNGSYLIIFGFGFIVLSYFFSIFIYTIFEMPFQNVRELYKKKAMSIVSAKEKLIIK